MKKAEVEPGSGSIADGWSWGGNGGDGVEAKSLVRSEGSWL